jgi:hypothetical protein
MIRQDVAVTPSAANGVIRFQAGSGYASINVAGFATLSIPGSGSSATLAVTGVSGAALTTLGDVLALNNTASSQNYTVTLARSAAPVAAIAGLNITIKDGTTTLVTWDVKTAGSAAPFTHVAGRVLNATVDLRIADGTSPGSLTGFDLQFTFVPV